jgi:hypothetical protein
MLIYISLLVKSNLVGWFRDLSLRNISFKAFLGHQISHILCWYIISWISQIFIRPYVIRINNFWHWLNIKHFILTIKACHMVIFDKHRSRHLNLLLDNIHFRVLRHTDINSKAKVNKGINISNSFPMLSFLNFFLENLKPPLRLWDVHFKLFNWWFMGNA